MSYAFDYDKAGFCAKCHTPVCEFDGYNNITQAPIVKKILPNFRSEFFLLDNGSQLKVTLCADCFDNLKPDHCQEIMESVINAEKQSGDLYVSLAEQGIASFHGIAPTWTKEKAEECVNNMKARRILNCPSRGWSDNERKKIKVQREDKLKL